MYKYNIVDAINLNSINRFLTCGCLRNYTKNSLKFYAN